MPEKFLQTAASWAQGSRGSSHAVTLQSTRVTTGAVGAASQAQVTVTWPSAFSSTSYTAFAAVEEGTAATDTLQVKKIVSRTTTQVVIRVINNDASARTGTLHVVGISD